MKGQGDFDFCWAVDETKHFQTALSCAVKLVLHSLDRYSTAAAIEMSFV